MAKAIDKLFQLPNGRSIAKSLLESVHKQVLARIPLLEKNIPCTAEMICGKHYWDGMPNSKKREAGMILLFLSEHDFVPLVLITPRDKKPLWYRLK